MATDKGSVTPSIYADIGMAVSPAKILASLLIHRGTWCKARYVPEQLQKILNKISNKILTQDLEKHESKIMLQTK